MPTIKAKAAFTAVNAVDNYLSNMTGKDVDFGGQMTEMQAEFKAVNDGDVTDMDNILIRQTIND